MVRLLELGPKQILCGLLVLNLYSPESSLCGMANVKEKTFRKYAWMAIKAIAQMKPQVVSRCLSLTQPLNHPV